MPALASIALLAGCGGGTQGSTETLEVPETLDIAPEDVAEVIESAEVVETLEAIDPAEEIEMAEPNASIETWLIEVGNDFPNEARCVAGEMNSYSVADFEKSFDGEINEPFESELDAAYAKCDSALGITTEE